MASSFRSEVGALGPNGPGAAFRAGLSARDLREGSLNLGDKVIR